MSETLLNPNTSKQETFNVVVRHLLAQNKVSEAFRLTEKGEKVWEPAYRGRLRKKCAIGILISDGKYTPQLEGKDTTHEDVLKAIYIGYYNEPEFLLKLQAIHDHQPESKWALRLYNMSEKEGIDFPNELLNKVKFDD